MNDRLTHLILIVVCIVVAFGRMCTSEFTYLDDNHTVSENRELNPPTAESITTFWTRIGPETPGSLYIPVTYTAWAGLAKVGWLENADTRGLRLNPWVFHTANVVVHILSAMTVYAILIRLLADGRAALFGALVYSVHPVMIEPVGWVSGFKDVLSGFLTLLSIYLYAMSRQIEYQAGGKMSRYVAIYVAAILTFLLAMLAKPSAVVAPLLALAMDRLVFSRSWKSSIFTLLPWFMLAVACAVIAKWTQPMAHVRSVQYWARPFVAGDSLAFYLKQILLPLNLGIDYGRFPTKVMQSPWVYVAWIIPVALGVACWMFRKRAPLVLLGATWFVVALLPTLGFVSFQFQVYSGVADHYLYVAMFGVAIVVAWLMVRFRSTLATGILTAIVILLVARSFVQARVWKDSVSLFSHTVKVNPESFIGWTNLAYEAQQRKDWDQAIVYTEKALPYGRNLVVGIYENLAMYLIYKGDIPRAIEVTDAAIKERYASPMQLRTTMTKRATDLGSLFQQRGYPDQARRLFEVVQQDAPKNAKNNQALEELDRLQRKPAATTRATSD